MKHIFKLQGKGNVFDKVAFNHAFGEITKKLADLDIVFSKKIKDLLIYWTQECIEYENCSINSQPFETEVRSLNNLIPILQNTIKSINLHKKLYGASSDEDNVLLSLNQYLKDMKNREVSLRGIKALNYRKSVIKSEAIFEVFHVGEELGLRANTKQGAGRGNINKLYSFVRIITGISSKDTINNYFKLYKSYKNINIKNKSQIKRPILFK